MSLTEFSALDQGFWNLYNFSNSGEECELEIEQKNVVLLQMLEEEMQYYENYIRFRNGNVKVSTYIS